MQGMLRKQISRLEWLCAIGFFFLYLYIHASIILRLGMNPDEILDFNGTEMARQTYLSNGRWGLAAWGKLVGGGYMPVSGGLTSGVILAITYLYHCRILLFSALKDKVLYGVISLACFQFYNMQVFSMQVEGVALGILLATLSCVVLLNETLKLKWRMLFSVLLLFCSLSFYQTCGLCFIVLYGLALVVKFRRGDEVPFMRHGWRVAVVCMGSIIAFLGVKTLWLHSGLLNSEAMEYCYENEKWIVSGSIFTGNWPELIEKLGSNIIGVVGVFLRGNSVIAAVFWCVCALLLSIRLCRTAKNKRGKLKGVTLYLLIIGIPFVCFICFISREDRSYLFLPILEAGICTLALKGIKFPRWGNVLLTVFLALSCIKASHSVALAAAKERAFFEHNDISLKLKYTEACRFALSQGMNPYTTRILVVEYDNNAKKVDFYGSYPLYPNFHLATWKDREKHAALIQRMPSWPAEGSIAESQGEIIIKAL